MVQSLPYKDIKFDNTIALEQFLQTGDDDETGYIIEADLEFPRERHDKFRQFPPCPEASTPQLEWFSNYKKS